MGLVHTEITLKNGGDVVKAAEGDIKQTDVRQVTVQTLVDTGAWTLVIDEQTRRHLGLRILGTESAALADGSQEFYSLAGPLEVNWKDRRASCDALVLPDADEILLGAIPLEAMDLTVNPSSEKLTGVHGAQVIHALKGGVKKC